MGVLMIDTIKIYTEIDKDTYMNIYNKSIIKTSYNKEDGEIFYEIINDHLEGSYDSRLSVRVGCGAKYHFATLGYYIEIEGSFHKITNGYNSHNGYYCLDFVSKSLIQMVELSYDIELPIFEKWYLQRCDIAICYNIENQDNVKSYINSLSRCNYPRRKPKFYYDESIYLSGTTTTLKIYNKYLEFMKHDLKKFINTEFELEKYKKDIFGFIRFECEIKKKKLQQVFNSESHIKIIDISYEELREVWSDEFMKVIKIINNDLKIVRGREEVRERLHELYKRSKACRLYNFYCSIQLNGENVVKEITPEDTFYRNIKALKEAKVDFSQTYRIEECDIFYFNPFEYPEVI